ncbi:MAG: CRTAC1 family protein [Gammaproteobacteria bacterium]|nr:CRTAC1 family protein [Gammaproteobacteria bacterium]NNF60529.1 CRTAC1 family protein [Gammaproteobacteria bacterium]NNM20289.1 CRTAC1 family protein [Gammaproteobacteria bacterium]
MAAPLVFSEQTAGAGLSFVHDQPLGHRAGPMAGGGAIGDFNSDGYPDLYVIGGGATPDRLYINNGDGTFSDQAARWGIARPHRGVGATVGDYDNDGDDDLFVSSFGPSDEQPGPGHHLLYRNDGNGFVDVAVAAGVAMTTENFEDGYGAAFGDYDLDGDLDLFVGAWHSRPVLGARLFRNEGNGSFTNVTSTSGVFQDSTHAFGAVWADMDGDRFPELLVAGDFGTNRYYRNNRDGTFTELDPGSGLPATQWSIGNAHNGMGTAVADFNRDGLPDWFITAIWPTYAFESEFWGNGLYINHGDHIYSEMSAAVGVNDGGWGWGTSAVDFDNDGWTDLAMTNGWRIYDPVTGANFVNERSYLWRSSHGAHFAEIGESAGLAHTGEGRAMLHFDYDRDGDMDLVILSNEEPLRLYRNDIISAPHAPADANWLQLRFDTHRNPRLAPQGIGAVVTVKARRDTQVQQVTTGGTYLGQSEQVLHFGLGRARRVNRITVHWADGSTTRLRGIRANHRVTVTARCRHDPSVRPRPGDCRR